MSQKSKSEDFPRICILGAGVSGMCAGVQLQKLGINNYVIFDENHDVGGTWLVNTYPGCACDVPSHLYSFSFEPNPNWSSCFATQPEILAYLQSIAKKHDLYKNIKFHHQIKRLSWDESISKWKVTVLNKESKNLTEIQLEFDIVLCGGGGLREPLIPEEFESFQGPKMHTAQWDPKIKLHGKKVGIVGTGASAVQIIPQIAEKENLKRLIVYQRNPPWVVPRLNFEFPEWMQWAFGTIPGIRQLYRASLFWLYEMSHSIYIKDSLLGKFGENLGKFYIKRQVGEKGNEMEKTLTPSYRIGCKRITPSDEYYSSLIKPHVQVVTSQIKEVKAHSILTVDGNEEKLDVLILATGYRVQDYFSPLEIIGKGDMNILKDWKTNGPTVYLGTCSSAMPNLFFIIGPNGAPGNTSAIFTVECQVNWIVQMIKHFISQKCKVVEVLEEVEINHTKKLREELKNTVWSTCNNYYRNAQGDVTALNSCSGFSYWRQTRVPDFSKFHFL